MKHFLLAFVAATTLSATFSCSTNAGSNTDNLKSLETGFHQPDSMTLGVYWYWISDNISKEGVIKDLEAMKQVGINRAFIGNVWFDNRPIFNHTKVRLLSPEWWEITHAALKRAGELGIEIGMFNSPGWSQSGGPWVKPEQSMRYLANSKLEIRGPQPAAQIRLPKVADDAMADVKVIAYQQFGNAQQTPEKNITISKKRGEEFSVDISLKPSFAVRTLIFKVDEPVRINTDAELFVKEGDQYRSLKKFQINRSNPSLNVGFDPYSPIVISLPETAATDYRLVLNNKNSEVKTAVVTLSSRPLIERYPEKTLAKMFQTPLPMWHDYLWDKQPEVAAELCINPAKVIDLTAKVKDGLLSWDIPEGNWVIMRTAMRTTRVTNGPASPEGTGLEIDKINKAHIGSHFDAFIGEVLRRIPAEDRTTFKVIVQDSYETGGLNWTDDMIERFRSVYSYDPTPYLPALNGEVVGSQDLSDRFLWDLRRLIATRVAYDYVGGLRDVSNKHGLTTWLENYGHWGFPGEFLMYGGQSDEIGGEFWSEGSLGDIENHAAASSAHIYGKRKVWAESCTSGGPAFSRYPKIMKPRIDRFLTEGINATILHVYVHQAYEELNPGQDADFGNEFNRKNTWFPHLDVFGKYLKRCNLMLQQGLFVADVAYFIGEDAPKMTGVRTPELPKGYAFDYINAEVLLTRASVKDGRLTLPDGMSYSLLVLPQLETIRPEVLAKIKDLVNEGLVILGPAPKRSPSLQNYPESDKQVTALAAELWSDGQINAVGQGKVFADGQTIAQVFEAIGVQPDLYIEDNPGVLYIHRTTPEGDIYFISNQTDNLININPNFRIAGRAPELWNPLTEEIRDLKEYSASGTTTVVPLQLQANESSFIVFRKKGHPSSSAKNFPEEKVITELNEPWRISFDNGQEEITKKLEDWSKSDEENIRYFSGKAIYSATFKHKTKTAKGRLYIDLGKVMVTAKVKINGVYAGGVWAYPYRLNVTKLLKEGENTLEVEVINNWMNRMIGDQKLPEAERTTWAFVNPWKADSKLQESGLTGPVRIIEIND